MFNFLKKKNPSEFELEISSNPSILFNPKVSVNQLLLFGISLGENYDSIIRSEIITTSMEMPPKNINAGSIFKDNKRYYFINGVEIEYLLNDRINSVIENDGWLHMMTGAKYRIKNKIVVEFSLTGEAINYFQEISKEAIQYKFGKADKIIKHYEEVDGTLFNTDFVYFKRRIRIYYQDWDKKISSINIGDTLLDYKKYR